MHWLLTVVLLIGTFGVGCLDISGCPCGAEPEDPFAEHDPSYTGDHIVDECVCQCGGDAPFGLPGDGECSEYNRPCTDDRGAAAELVCE